MRQPPAPAALPAYLTPGAVVHRARLADRPGFTEDMDPPEVVRCVVDVQGQVPMVVFRSGRCLLRQFSGISGTLHLYDGDGAELRWPVVSA